MVLVPAPVRADAWEQLRQPDEWFRSDEGRECLENVLSWQSPEGGWPKNEDTTRKPFRGDRDELHGTFDNKATTGELRLLERAWEATRDKEYRKAFLKGFDHVLEAQYPNGGWPQYFPLSKAYHRHITFNDGSMVRVLDLLRDAEDFKILDLSRRRKARQAVERGIDCIVKCQIVVDGEPTVWCAQHDEKTLAPAKARAYELPSFSGAESAGILHFLMSIDRPSPEVVKAIEGGVRWFDTVKLTGVRYERRNGRVVEDPGASPIWARFYDLETGKPIFCDRDGVKRFSLEEVGRERRTGYAWFGNWGESVARDHAKWSKRR